ncbi:MAG TPA: bL17 family ribosomal protein, partial [Candidatus Saccharimonadia bacterium]
MHRHGYQGKKLQLAAAPRRALIRGQVTSLVLHEQITTTEAKAKEIAPYFERLVTKAKKGDLH